MAVREKRVPSGKSWYETFEDVKFREERDSKLGPDSKQRRSHKSRLMKMLRRNKKKKKKGKLTLKKKYPRYSSNTMDSSSSPARVTVVDHLFMVDVSDGPVAKRTFADFIWLRRCLKAMFPGVALPGLPPAIGGFLFSRNDVEEKTSQGLEKYINTLLSTPYLRESEPFVLFVSSKKGFKTEKIRIENQLKAQGYTKVLMRYKKIFPRAFAMATSRRESVASMKLRVDRLRSFVESSKGPAEKLLSSSRELHEALVPLEIFAKAAIRQAALDSSLAEDLGFDFKVPPARLQNEGALRECREAWKRNFASHFEWEAQQADPLLESMEYHGVLLKSYHRADEQKLKFSRGSRAERASEQAETLLTLARVVTELILNLGCNDAWDNRRRRFEFEMQRFGKAQHKAMVALEKAIGSSEELSESAKRLNGKGDADSDEEEEEEEEFQEIYADDIEEDVRGRGLSIRHRGESQIAVVRNTLDHDQDPEGNPPGSPRRSTASLSACSSQSVPIMQVLAAMQTMARPKAGSRVYESCASGEGDPGSLRESALTH